MPLLRPPAYAASSVIVKGLDDCARNRLLIVEDGICFRLVGPHLPRIAPSVDEEQRAVACRAVDRVNDALRLLPRFGYGEINVLVITADTRKLTFAV